MRTAVSCCILMLSVWTTSQEAVSAPHFAIGRPLDMEHIKLEMRVSLEHKQVKSRATLSAVALRGVDTIKLDAVDFEEVSVAVRYSDGNWEPCEFENSDEHLVLSMPRKLEGGQSLSIRIDYLLNDPARGLHFFAPSEDDAEVPYMLWSQGQSITNRYWVPCFDHPNEMQTTEIICTVDDPYKVISNGTLMSVKENPDKTRTFHWHQQKPHVSYLMTLVIGEFFTKTEQWRGRPISYHVRPKFKDRIDNSFANTLPMLDFFSEKIGVDYPWSKYDQVCCYQFGGGMENTSSTTLGEGTLHDDRAHLDTSSDGLVAHELAHQWFGDLLTCRDWSHLWLNEGFASYFEALWDEENVGAEAFAYNMKRKARRAISGGRDKPVVYRDYKSPGEQFDSRAYPKGAWVVHMIRRRLGDDLFWQVIKEYVTRYRHKTVETVDLRKTIEEVTGRSFERFFHDWTARPGNPNVTVKYRWDAEDKVARIDIEQKQKAEAFHFPLELEFRFEKEKPFVMTAEVTEKKTSLHVPLKRRPALFRVDPHQSVLMELKVDQPTYLWVAQLEDPNPVARMAAIQHLADEQVKEERIAACLQSDGFWAVRAEAADVLSEVDDDAARAALLNGLTAEHPKVRAAVVEALSVFSDDAEVESALAAIVSRGDPSYRVEANAIEAYAHVSAESPLKLLASTLDRESHREQVRVAALEAIGIHCDAEHFGLLLEWAKPGKPMRCRSAAVGAIASAITMGEIPEDAVDRALDRLDQCLAADSSRVRRATLSALSDMGLFARPLLPAIDELAEDKNGRTARAAKRAAEAIRSEKVELEALQDQLDSLRERYRLLVDRLNELESAQVAD